jgi:hypothetical protein
MKHRKKRRETFKIFENTPLYDGTILKKQFKKHSIKSATVCPRHFGFGAARPRFPDSPTGPRTNGMAKVYNSRNNMNMYYLGHVQYILLGTASGNVKHVFGDRPGHN